MVETPNIRNFRPTNEWRQAAERSQRAALEKRRKHDLMRRAKSRGAKIGTILALSFIAAGATGTELARRSGVFSSPEQTNRDTMFTYSGPWQVPDGKSAPYRVLHVGDVKRVTINGKKIEYSLNNVGSIANYVEMANRAAGRDISSEDVTDLIWHENVLSQSPEGTTSRDITTEFIKKHPEIDPNQIILGDEVLLPPELGVGEYVDPRSK